MRIRLALERIDTGGDVREAEVQGQRARQNVPESIVPGKHCTGFDRRALGTLELVDQRGNVSEIRLRGGCRRIVGHLDIAPAARSKCPARSASPMPAF